MIKIAFVSPGKLPQPAVKGGAVEGLIDLLVESLVERYDKYDVHVYSIGENDEDKIISGVKYHYIKNHGFSNQIARKTRGIINALSKNIYVGNNYIDNVANRIHNEKCLFDCCSECSRIWTCSEKMQCKKIYIAYAQQWI